MPPIPVVVDDRHRHHDPPFELNVGQRVAPVYERPQRIDAIRSALEAAGHACQPARPHEDGAILSVHDEGLVTFLREGYTAWRDAGGPDVMIADTFRSPRWASGGRPSASPLAAPGWWCFDTATPIVAGSFVAARAAADVALTAAALVADGAPVAYGLTRPPGHHAGHDYFGGFCLLNHAAIAAHSLTSGGRVAVLDVDVHHGNGTQDIFWRSPEVLYVSLHADPDHLYPYFSGSADEIGAGPGRGTTHNVPLPAGTDDERYLEALTRALEVIDGFDPATLVVSVGFDAAEADPIGSLALTEAGLHGVGQRIASLQRPTVLLQEGGYAVDRLGGYATALLSGLDLPG